VMELGQHLKAEYEAWNIQGQGLYLQGQCQDH
jgi:hypothetical protein